MKNLIGAWIAVVLFTPAFTHATEGPSGNRGGGSDSGGREDNGKGKERDKDDKDRGKGKDDNKNWLKRVEVLEKRRTGPPDYFNVYGSIRTSVIRHGKMHLRTVDGEEMDLNNSMYTLDLQDLTGVGKGLTLSLKNVVFPEGRTSLDIAEIWVDLEPDVATALTFASGRTCDLRVPHRLAFTLPGPFTVLANDYYVKVAFAPLADVQIDRVIVTTQEYLCPPVDKWVPACVPIGAPEVRENLICVLSSHRLPIMGIVRRSDEF